MMEFPRFLLTVDSVGKECYKGLKKGDTFELKDFVTPPDGFCYGAYHSLFPVIYAWTFGAEFPFKDKEGCVRTTCPDGGNLTFKVKKL